MAAVTPDMQWESYHRAAWWLAWHLPHLNMELLCGQYWDPIRGMGV